VRVLVAVGTRPEAIKLVPVIQALRAQGVGWETRVVTSGQHQRMAQEVLALFGIEPDYCLPSFERGVDLNRLLTGTMARLEPIVAQELPDLLLVQGDTTTALASALTGFNLQVPIGHVEAGLRSRDLGSPFPEEMNRAVIDRLSQLHFAPTKASKMNLLREGVSPETIFVTGNTVVDALLGMLREYPDLRQAERRPGDGGQRLLVTLHRRESWGDPMRRVVEAIRAVALRHPTDLTVLFPVHPNPVVRETVMPILRGHANVSLVEPLDYLSFVRALLGSSLVLSDSGGVQEEATALGRPVLVARDVTERPEVLESGCGRVVGTDRSTIVETIETLLSSPETMARMATPSSALGDGRAAERIVATVYEQFGDRIPSAKDRSATEGMVSGEA
jgi:UDP-N-acetylglucosamine 2-epimerase (non-hydrolysing)